jgi:hypothetical protein
VRMPTFSRHSGPTSGHDAHDEARTTTVRDVDRSDEPTEVIPPTHPVRQDTAQAARDRDAAERAAFRAQTAEAETKRDAAPAPAGPRPRASLLATMSLIAAVAAVLFTLSGALAGYGIALGVLAVVLSLGGISATGRRHVAGKTDALFGLFLGLGAIVLGILAVTGSLSWLTADAEPVSRFREWLDTQFVDRI